MSSSTSASSIVADGVPYLLRQLALIFSIIFQWLARVAHLSSSSSNGIEEGERELVSTSFSSLPSVVISRITEYFNQTEVLAFEALVSKQLTKQLMHGGDPLMWSKVIERCMNDFLPARAYYDGPGNETENFFRPKTGRQRFPRKAKGCDAVMNTYLIKSGLASADCAAPITWEWEMMRASRRDGNVAMSYIINPRVVVHQGSLCIVDKATYIKWGTTFACHVCHAFGGAKLQCASCGHLLCDSSCSVKCFHHI